MDIGLTTLREEDIGRRLKAEPRLSFFEVEARILSQTLTGVEALQPFGYYHPLIEAELTHKDKDWIATYHVDPGPPVTITRSRAVRAASR